MIIKNYDLFLLESIIQTSDDFMKILNSMKGDLVADELLQILPNDIKTNYNFIKLSNELGKLSFLPDSQANRRLSAGDSADDIFAAASNSSTINRVVKSILDANGIKVSDVALEAFGNRFKAKMSLLMNKDMDIRVVEGEEIRKWYLESIYTKARRGTLHTSCMRYEHCQEYLDIYVYNKDVVKLIIKVDEDGNLRARALIWKTDQGTYVDRVYWTHEEEKNLIYDWAALNFGEIMNYIDDSNTRLKVNLSKYWFDSYPYMDSFSYLVGSQLQTWEPRKPGDFKELMETDGGYISGNQVWSDWHGERIDADDAVFSRRMNSWLFTDDAVYSDYLEDYIPDSMAKTSKKYGYLHTNDSVEVIDSEGNKDVYPDDKVEVEDWILEESEGIFYHKSHIDKLEQIGNKWYKKGSMITVYKLTEESRKKFQEIYWNESQHCSELDLQVFGLETTYSMNISKSEFWFAYRFSWLKEVIDLIKKQKCSEELKEKKIEEQHEVDNYWREKEDDFYIRVNDTLDKLGDRQKLIDIWNEEVDKSDNTINYVFDWILDRQPTDWESAFVKKALKNIGKNRHDFSPEEKRELEEKNMRILSIFSIFKQIRVKIIRTNILVTPEDREIYEALLALGT